MPRTHPGFGSKVMAMLAAALVVTVAVPARGAPPSRVPGQPALRAAVDKPPLLRPNLVVLRAKDLYVVRTAEGRKLRFESAMGNVGRGPVEVRPRHDLPCPGGKEMAIQVTYRDVDGSGWFRRKVDTEVHRRRAGCMVYHPQHDHWHFQAAARYVLTQLQDDGSQVVSTARKKMSFCLRDSRRLPESYGTFHQREYYGTCSRTSPMGISTGWSDVYQSFLAGQALRLPARAEDGVYCLRIRVDPKDQLKESNDLDNTSVRAFQMTGDTISYLPNKTCTP